LIAILAGHDETLQAELERQNAFIRFDGNINAYLIHHLFLDFLRTKQEMLTEEEKLSTYRAAADWCGRNGFKADALSYYEKIGDYESIVSVFFELPIMAPGDVALRAAGIFERAPAEAFDRVNFFAVMHVRMLMCLGKWKEALELLERYETKFLRLPKYKALRNHTLAGIYYCWGIIRQLMCAFDDRCDFHIYYAKMDECLSKSPVEPGKLGNHPVGPWVNLAGFARARAPREYIDALAGAVKHTSRCLNGCMAGADDLALGELKFYQGDAREAEPLIVKGLAAARENRQFELVHRALTYLMRIAVSQGNHPMAEQALKDMETQLSEDEYSIRFITYDVALGWYHSFLLQPEKIPNQLKEKFMPHSCVYAVESLTNQVKAGYCYLTKDYAPLLAYMEEQRRRESTLFGRVELLAMEACVYFKMKDRAAAFTTLLEAYETALPNAILMPFICLGKDMRTLSSAALRNPDCGISRPWLETIGRKSATYAKRHAKFLSDYKKANGVYGEVTLSSRETEVLRDMYHGLSRAEIAAGMNLSINTVKLFVNSIYEKLNANNIADVIRIAAERKLV
jgi:ATP/maltotriose-dependent transcriptional regulator MalT